MKIRNSFLLALIAIFLVLNVYLFLRHGSMTKPIPYKPQAELPGIKNEEVAPAFVLKDLEGISHSTDELKGKITLLIFREIKDEKSFLEAYYYKLLLGKYRDKGFVVWIISTAKDSLAVKDVAKVYSPILVLKDKDGEITKKYCNKEIEGFRAFIIDRDGIVKFRDYNLPNILVRMTVDRFVLNEEKLLGEDEFVKGQNLPSLEYYDVKDNSIKKLADFVGKPILLTLFSANCPTCREHKRLLLMQSAYEEYGPKGLRVVLVYGKDNPLSIIRDYVQKAKLSYDVGVRKVEPEESDSYYKNYDLEVDPKSIIVTSDGKVIFIEDLKDTQENISKAIDELFKDNKLRKKNK
ncbi:MAG TPA: redoxin domain-containing protein [candidate division Zixibacteria bacterium]